MRLPVVMFGVFAVLLALTVGASPARPPASSPDQDQGNLIAAIQLPAGASLDRTDQITRQVTQAHRCRRRASGRQRLRRRRRHLQRHPVQHRPDLPGARSVRQAAAARATAEAIAADLRKRMAAIPAPTSRSSTPPPVRGIGTAGGFKMIIQDRTQHSLPGAGGGRQRGGRRGQQERPVPNAFVSFNTKTPRIYADIDRTKAEVLGVPDTNVFDTLQTYLGSTFINTSTIRTTPTRSTPRPTGHSATTPRRSAS